MILLYVNNTDTTGSLERDSLRITEQLNNRVNTCSFSVTESEISEGQKIEIFEAVELREETTSGSAVLRFYEDVAFIKKFRPGEEIILDIKGSGETNAVIDSVDLENKQVKLTENVSSTIARGKKIGKIAFAGTAVKVSDSEFAKCGKFEYTVSCSDWSEALNRQVVVDTYANQYMKEIVSKILYKFTDRENEKILTSIEDTDVFTTGGNATTAAFSSDVVTGNFSLKMGSSGSGLSTYTASITSVDMTGKTDLRSWIKLADGIHEKISDLTIKVGNDSSNYIKYKKTLSDSNYWLFDTMFSKDMETVGTVDLSSIDWIQVEFTATEAISSGSVLLDSLRMSEGGFYLDDSFERGATQFEDIRFQYRKVTDCIEELAKLQGKFWYMDYMKGLHFFSNNKKAAAFNLTDTSENYSKLSISADMSNLKNRQTVRGGQAPSEAIYVQERVADGEEESWQLDYPPKDLQVFVDTGSGYVEKTVGVENLVAETSVEYLFNFNEKVVRRGTDSILSSGHKIKLQYYPYKAIRVQVKDSASVEKMKALVGGEGIFDGAVITDSTIRTFEEARQRAKAEVNAYSNAILTASFQTEQDGLTAGQVIHITDTSRGIDSDFLIQKVQKTSKNQDSFRYKVTAGSTMFGIIEFFQLLLKRSEEGLIDVSEIVDIVSTLDEVLNLKDLYTFTQKSNIFYAMGESPGLTPNDAYADFSEVS